MFDSGALVALVRETYAPGTRVRFFGFGVEDKWTKLAFGTEGTVRLVDGLGTVHVEWDDGCMLGMILVPGPGEKADSIGLLT